MMTRYRRRLHSPGLLAGFAVRLIGRGQLLIQAGDRLPLVLASYPRGRSRYALTLNSALRAIFPALPATVRGNYDEVLDRLPPLIVADLRACNLCSCLGHHHPRISHTGLTRRLAADVGDRVAEIDLAVDAIRDWEPLPLATLAAQAGVAAEVLGQTRFQTALLAVFLHELEHVAFPERSEKRIRQRSDQFYVSAIRAQLASEYGIAFGISAQAVA
jgi:hypothetical protein